MNDLNDAPAGLKALLFVYLGAGTIATGIFIVTAVIPAILSFVAAHAGAFTIAAAYAIIKALVSGKDPVKAVKGAGIDEVIVGMFVDLMKGLKEQFLSGG